MIDLFKKIIFLTKSKAKLNIILIFLLTKIKNIFFKSQIKKFKKDNKFFLQKKNITHDYFSPNAFNFQITLENYKSFDFLEIGSFEGNATMFVARRFPNCKIVSVDNWIGTEEYKNLNFNHLEKNFDENVKEFKNITKIKSLSDDYFKNYNTEFDIIYIDGYHKAEQVYKDFKNAWKVLRNNGTIIFDDYIWQFYNQISDNPCFAINSYLAELNKNYKIIRVSNSQLFIKKNEQT